MTNETATPEKKALLDAFDTVLRTQAEQREAQQREEEARRRARARTRPLMWTCVAIVLFVAAYLWIERPEWVFPAPPVPESAAVQDASLRIAMANTAQHLERYRRRNGRLPAALAEVGAPVEGITYEQLAGGSQWGLSGRNGSIRLRLVSTEPLDKFLGKSFEVISRRER
jgi:hypothetical protein